MSLIDIQNLTFAYPGSFDNVFDNASFQIDTKWKIGLIGRNGRGKTTLLNLLMNQYEYSGLINSKVKFEYFPYVVKNHNSFVIDVINEITKDTEYWLIKKEIYKMELNEEILYENYGNLSYGEQTKILLVALFLKENHFLLIDEPTNHLDIKGCQTVSNYLTNKQGFILVSHNRVFLDNTVNYILAINKSKIDIQKGNFSSWYYNKQLLDNEEIQRNDQLKKEIKRLSKASQDTVKWADKIESSKSTKISGIKPDKGYIGHQSAKMMQRARNLQNRQALAAEEKKTLLKDIERYDELKIHQLEYYSSLLISLNKISINWDNKTIVKNISFDIKKGDRIAIIGENGSGKSSLLKLINRGNINYNGDLNMSNKLVISYVSQNIDYLNGELSEYIYDNNIDEPLFKAILNKLDFPNIQFEKRIEDYSSGQKKKVLIAHSLATKAHLYIWDEPLNYIDIFSRIQIEKMLIEYKPTIVFVEHDENFINKVSTKKIFLQRF